MAVIYCADIYCDACGDDIKRRIARDLWNNRDDFDGLIAIEACRCVEDIELALDEMDERSYDSNEYPKWCSDDEESDCPQHCGSHGNCLDPYVDTDGEKYGHFFGNDLTTEGYEYVVNTVREDRKSGHTDSIACTLWASHYLDEENTRGID